ncbi:NCK-interacting protein with SH3 domain-like, partial [Pocillopora damicornis]|uniref:NCK-interacting protein with SH3 domain-like n=1 Tax=Pocillopora damicornis TaxID=46731 RepID=UPI000F551D36
MYRSIYHLTSKDKGVLPIHAGDIFEFIEQHDEHWWRMRARDSSVGLVPACYLEPVDNETADPGERQAVLESVDRAIEAIHAQVAASGGFYTREQRANLRKLLEHRNRINSRDKAGLPAQPRRPAPAPPSGKDKNKKKKETTKRRPAPAAPTTSASTWDTAVKDQVPAKARESTPPPAIPERPDLESVTIRPGIAAELLELLRMNTGLSYDKSSVAVHTVLSHIHYSVPSTSNVMAQLIQDLEHQKESRTEDEEALLQSNDGQQLITILDELTEHKEDSQQRSWAVHDDEGILHKLLKNLHSILVGQVSLCDIKFQSSFVLFYFKEERQSLRQLLVEIFGCLCGLKKEILSQLLCSVLPSELAMEIMKRKEGASMQRHCAILMTMIFSTGESVPYTVYDQVNDSFVEFLIDAIETSEHEEEFMEAFTPLILAFNHHFVDIQSNIVMRVLASRSAAKTLSEKIVLLLNREEDPTALFQYPRSSPDAVLKFVTDIFSSRDTSEFFYALDMKVLIEIVLRQMADLSPGAG